MRRAVELALRERWEVILEQRKAGRKVLARRLAQSVVQEGVGREVRCAVVREGRERRERGDWWGLWKARAEKARVERGVRERVWREVVGEIGVGPVVDVDEWEEEEEELGMAGLSLSVGGRDERAKEADRDMAARVKQVRARLLPPPATEADPVHDAPPQAEADRQRIWSRGTFLDIVSSRIDSAFSRLPRTSTRQAWSVLLATPEVGSPFAAWLACKFDLDVEGWASMDTGPVDVGVQMVGGDEGVGEEVRCLVEVC